MSPEGILLVFAGLILVLGVLVVWIGVARQELRRDFEGEFGFKPRLLSEGSYRNRALQHVRERAFAVGQAALGQEQAQKQGLRGSSLSAIDRQVESAKTNWAEAIRMLRKVSPSLSDRIQHWSKEKPYAR